MRNTKAQNNTIEKRKTNKASLSFINNKDFDMWILLDQTRDVVAKARELELNHYHLTRAQASLLFILLRQNRGLTISEISNWNMREPNSVLSLINRMEKSGMVKKSKNTDAAKITITISDKGREMYTNASRRSVEMIFEVLTEEEKQQLKSGLKKVRAKSRELLGIDFKPPFLP